MQERWNRNFNALADTSQRHVDVIRRYKVDFLHVVFPRPEDSRLIKLAKTYSRGFVRLTGMITTMEFTFFKSATELGARVTGGRKPATSAKPSE